MIDKQFYVEIELLGKTYRSKVMAYNEDLAKNIVLQKLIAKVKFKSVIAPKNAHNDLANIAQQFAEISENDLPPTHRR